MSASGRWRCGRLPRAGKASRDAAGEDGQSTVEYLLVVIGVLAMLLALGALARAGGDGVLAGAATSAASHSAAHGIFANVLLDVLLY